MIKSKSIEILYQFLSVLLLKILHDLEFLWSRECQIDVVLRDLAAGIVVQECESSLECVHLLLQQIFKLKELVDLAFLTTLLVVSEAAPGTTAPRAPVEIRKVAEVRVIRVEVNVTSEDSVLRIEHRRSIGELSPLPDIEQQRAP